MQTVRILEIPACKAVSSGIGMFGDGVLERFDAWFSTLPRELYPRDFLFWDSDGEKSGFHWIYLLREEMPAPEAFPVIDFPGGLYAVVTGIDGQTDDEEKYRTVDDFLAKTGFVRDPERKEMGNVLTPPPAENALGYLQMDYYLPIRTADSE